MTTRERPILFSAPMVRAILAGNKTATRRVVTARNSLDNGDAPCMKRDPEIIGAWCNLDFNDVFVDPGPSPAGNPGPYLKVAGGDGSRHRVYPRMQPGDRMWVKETFCLVGDETAYRADLTDGQIADERVARSLMRDNWPRWKPSIFMARAHSRITLAVTQVRPERLQDIDEADARAEGVVPLQMDAGSYLPRFEGLWDSINDKRPGCAWADNPWVWAIAFSQVTP